MVRSTIFSQLEVMYGVHAGWICTLYILALAISFALGIRKQNGCHYSSLHILTAVFIRLQS